MKNTLVLALALGLVPSAASAGLHFGMANAAKAQVEQLDQKVRDSRTATEPPKPPDPPTPVTTDKHTILFRNNCGETVWVGAQKSSGPDGTFPMGWEMPASSSHTIVLPNSWSGRFWPRTGCNFTNCTGPYCCITGDCGKSAPPACDTGKGGEAPATLMEITFNGSGDQDYYDISFVDGFNRSMSVEPWGTYDPGSTARWCDKAGCMFTDALDSKAPLCPSKLKYAPDANRSCISPCKYLTSPTSTVNDETKARHCCSCSESNLSPGAKCDNGCNSYALGYGYNCSPYNNDDIKNHPDCLCDPLQQFYSIHHNPNKDWNDEFKPYINNIQSTCSTVYAWQYHDDHGLYQCRRSTNCSTAGKGCMGYIVTFCPS